MVPSAAVVHVVDKFWPVKLPEAGRNFALFRAGLRYRTRIHGRWATSHPRIDPKLGDIPLWDAPSQYMRPNRVRDGYLYISSLRKILLVAGAAGPRPRGRCTDT